jgi:ribonuclease I
MGWCVTLAVTVALISLAIQLGFITTPQLTTPPRRWGGRQPAAHPGQDPKAYRQQPFSALQSAPHSFVFDAAFVDGAWKVHGLWPTYTGADRSGDKRLCQFKTPYADPVRGTATFDFVNKYWLGNKHGPLGLLRHEWDKHGCKHWTDLDEFVEAVRAFREQHERLCDAQCANGGANRRCRLTCSSLTECEAPKCGGRWIASTPRGGRGSVLRDPSTLDPQAVAGSETPTRFVFEGAYVDSLKEWKISGLWPMYAPRSHGDGSLASVHLDFSGDPYPCAEHAVFTPPPARSTSHRFISNSWLPDANGSSMGRFQLVWQRHGCRHWDNADAFVRAVSQFVNDGHLAKCDCGWLGVNATCRLTCSALDRCESFVCGLPWNVTVSTDGASSSSSEDEHSVQLRRSVMLLSRRPGPPKIVGLWPILPSTVDEAALCDVSRRAASADIADVTLQRFVQSHWANPLQAPSLLKHATAQWSRFGCAAWPSPSAYVAHAQRAFSKFAAPLCATCGDGQRCALVCNEAGESPASANTADMDCSARCFY